MESTIEFIKFARISLKTYFMLEKCGIFRSNIVVSIVGSRKTHFFFFHHAFYTKKYIKIDK